MVAPPTLLASHHRSEAAVLSWSARYIVEGEAAIVAIDAKINSAITVVVRTGPEAYRRCDDVAVVALALLGP